MASRKRKQRNLSAGRAAMIVIVVGLLIGIALVVKNIVGLTIEKRALTEQNNELANKRDELATELENVNDLDYIEEQARKLLHMIKPGEILYVLSGSSSRPDPGESNGIDLPEREEGGYPIQPDDTSSDSEDTSSEESYSGEESYSDDSSSEESYSSEENYSDDTSDEETYSDDDSSEDDEDEDSED